MKNIKSYIEFHKNFIKNSTKNYWGSMLIICAFFYLWFTSIFYNPYFSVLSNILLIIGLLLLRSKEKKK